MKIGVLFEGTSLSLIICFLVCNTGVFINVWAKDEVDRLGRKQDTISAMRRVCLENPLKPSFSHIPGQSVERLSDTLFFLVKEDFENQFPNGNWERTDTWGISINRQCEGLFSAYCSETLAPAPEAYAKLMSSWLITKPLDLSGCVDGGMQFKIWGRLEADSLCSQARLFAGVSIDGQWFNGTPYCGEKDCAVISIDFKDVPVLGNICGETNVRVGFLFTSDSSETREGVYIDEIEIWAQPCTPVIQLLKPASGEVWEENSDQQIEWHHECVSETVLLQYSTDNGVTWQTIQSAKNNGSFIWTVPEVDEDIPACLVRIVDAEDPDVFAVTSVAITDTRQGCRLAMLSPNGGEIWDEGSTQVIIWEANDPKSSVKLSFSRDGGKTWTTIISSTPDDGRRYWSAPVVHEDEYDCFFKIQSNDDTTCFDVSDDAFTIKNTCAMQILFPNGNDFLQPGTVRSIMWTPVDESGDVKIDISTNGGTFWTTIENSTPDDGLYEWPVPEINSKETLMRVTSLSQPRCSDISDAHFIIGECAIPSLQATAIKGVIGETHTVDILVHENHAPITSFGFELLFNPDHLIFVSIQKGPLTRDWIQVDGAESAAGVVRVGGYHTPGIPAGSDGCIAKIIFRVGCNGCSTKDQSSLHITNLLDDVSGMNVCGGFFEYDIECTLGDVNMDGNITPADALCAFQVYMNDNDPADIAGCDTECSEKSGDATCDGWTTPQDARDIFEAYVTGTVPECPDDLSKQVPAEATLAIAGIDAGRDDFKVPLRLNKGRSLDAFGIDVRYPADQLDFSGLEAGAITAGWEMLDAVDNDGTVRVGGFTLEKNTGKRSGDFLTLHFKRRPNAGETVSFEIAGLCDDLATARVLEGPKNAPAAETFPGDFGLAQNFPNPFNMATELVYHLPESRHVTLTVFDIIGRVVNMLVDENLDAGTHHVVWNGLDSDGVELASGIYFAVLHSRGQRQRVKMVMIK